ncbi:hypothetical protein ANME2D_01135 [Candidatus Methanoperedens nitroreducens]|uniref:Uncharacterized protein n=1 Tax=Candidatus Methanoperedens nitratireducens TaxID=1392998 RepID=A0A062VAD9_9EURY|nr:hypothetical protein [Candidatus Methanoperedens nitroreducens]KCZ72704.1 hypothetical protein ANME2D_01135 [Candidatus Methanoperedens nitroreducens]MDJ1423363.1 hypothetical protein [Candidatus Methanoperedens sp.]
MRSKILAVLLILSISGNIYLVSLIQPEQNNLQEPEVYRLKMVDIESNLNSTPGQYKPVIRWIP